MANGDQSNNFTMQTPAPILQPKQQYLNLLMNTLYECSKICSTPAPIAENKHRISMLVRMMIAYIPNEETRDELYKYRNDELNAFKKRNGDATQLIDYTFTVDCQIIGKIMTVLDQLLAITDRQVVMLCGESTENLEAEFYPDGMSVGQATGEGEKVDDE